MDGYEKERRHSFFVKAGSFYGLCLRRRGEEGMRRRGEKLFYMEQNLSAPVA